MNYLLGSTFLLYVITFALYWPALTGNQFALIRTAHLIVTIGCESALLISVILRCARAKQLSLVYERYSAGLMPVVNEDIQERVAGTFANEDDVEHPDRIGVPHIVALVFGLLAVLGLYGLKELHSVPGVDGELLAIKVGIILSALFMCIGVARVDDLQKELVQHHDILAGRLLFFSSQELQKSRVFHLVTEVVEAFSRERDVAPTLQKILQETQDLLGMQVAWLDMTDRHTGRHYRMFLPEDAPAIGDELAERMAGPAELHQRADRSKGLAEILPEGCQSLMHAPVGVGTDARGFIAGAAAATTWSGNDLNVLTMLSMQAGLLVENAGLLEHVRQLSLTDSLTGLANKRHLMQQLEASCTRARRYGTALSLIMLDVDHFKHYNDTNGHPAGDAALRQVSSAIRQTVRDSDVPARYGGEEFVVILSDTDQEGAAALAERLRVCIEEQPFPFEEEQPEGKLTVSIGVSIFAGEDQTEADFLAIADGMLYQAKRDGRNRVCVSD